MRNLIFDLDDTISFTTNRDFTNAKPNIELIEKMRKLHKEGWNIIICTARGSISCKTRTDAEKKYKKDIETWLKKHDVPYSELSFQKHLGQYYIDDKAIKPDDFLKLEIKKLKGGLSGDLVELRGDKVFKIDKNAINTVKWYDMFKNIINAPKIYSLIGNEIQMEYIENNTDLKLDVILDDILKFKNLIPKHEDFVYAEIYKERILKHIEYSEKDLGFLRDFVEDIFFKYGNDMDNGISYCHGDLSISNILVKDGNHYYIDPIYDEKNFSSYLLDISKLTYSLNITGDYISRQYLTKKFVDLETSKDWGDRYYEIRQHNIRLIYYLEFLHAIRVYKYANDELKSRIFELYFNKIKK